VCPSCGFVNHHCGRQRYCDPEGVVVGSDPFPSLPSLAAPKAARYKLGHRHLVGTFNPVWEVQ